MRGYRSLLRCPGIAIAFSASIRSSSSPAEAPLRHRLYFEKMKTETEKLESPPQLRSWWMTPAKGPQAEAAAAERVDVRCREAQKR